MDSAQQVEDVFANVHEAVDVVTFIIGKRKVCHC